MRNIFTLIGIFCIAISTNAQPLFTDDFDYGSTSGSIITLSNGKWLQNTNQSSVNVIQYDPSSSLVFPNFTPIGGRLSILSTGQDITAALSTSVTSNNLYAAFLVNFSAAQTVGDYFFHLMPNVTTNTLVGRVFVKLNGSNINFGLMKNNGGTVPYSTTAYDLNTTYCVVLKYAFNPDGTSNDVASLYVFNAATGLPDTEPATAELTITANTDATSLGAIAVRQGAATGGATATLDKIVVDTTWPNFFAALPTILEHFNAKPHKNGVELQWQSINEHNFSYYQIEKSINGINFSSIATMQAKAINGNRTTYQFFDTELIENKQYYRLKMVDTDGKYKYSEIIFVNTKQDVAINIYPNPVTDKLVITHPLIKEKTSVAIYTAEGKLVRLIVLANGTTQNTIAVVNLAKGNYILKFSNSHYEKSISFIK